MPPDKNFYTEFRVLNSNTEIPAIYTMWCSLSAISAALARRVYIDMGAFKIYPNMYITLIAGSGHVRKSTAIGVSASMLRQLSPAINLIAQKITAQKLIMAMVNSSGKEPLIPTDGKIGQGFLIADELTTFLNQSSSESGIVPMLTKLYDCDEVFDYDTIGRGKESIRETQLGILSGTTPEELRKAIPQEAIGAGLASRFIFVFCETREPPVAFPQYTDEQRTAKEYCVRFLSRICSSLSGPIPIPSDCRDWLSHCYKVRCYNGAFMDDPNLRGYASRRFNHILKIAINLSVGFFELPQLNISILERAEELVMENEKSLQRVIHLVTMNEKGFTTHYVGALIARAGEINRTELVKSLSNKLDDREILEVINTLKSSGLVEIVVNGPRLIYRWTGAKR